MFSPSKKPKRSLCDDDDAEDFDADTCCTITPAKKQKTAHSESFITSSPSPCANSLKTPKASPHSTAPHTPNFDITTTTDSLSEIPNNAYLVIQEEVTTTTTTTTTTTLFSPSFTFHQKESDSSSEEELELSPEEEDANTHINEESEDSTEEEITKEQQIVQATWYELPQGVSVEEEIEEIEEELSEFNPYLFIKNLPAHQPALRTLLPPRLSSDPQLCLVLDLDETLVHCSTEMLLPADLMFPVVFNNVEYTVFARKRPYIEEFLSQMSALFEIVVFTASQEVYADRLLNILDPEKKYIRHRLFRDSCVCVEGNYLKDLTILGRDLSKVIIVDNSPQAFGYQVDNGIPIESWFDDEADQELLRLVPFLESMLDQPDVRPVIREKFKLYELISRSA